MFLSGRDYNFLYEGTTWVHKRNQRPGWDVRLPEWTGRPQIYAAGCFLSVLAAIAVVAFAIGTLEYTKTRGKLLLTALLVAGFFVTLVGATAMPRSGLGPWFRPAAIGVAVSALLLMVVGLWGTPDSNAFWKATASVTVLAMGLVAAGQALSRTDKSRTSGVAGILVALLSVSLTVMAVLGIALEIRAVAYWFTFGLAIVGWVLAAALGIVADWRLRKSQERN